MPTIRVPRGVVLATVCVAVFAINLDTTVVNVALPSIGRQLGVGTSTLQWVVDGYSLAFAALVLTGGAVGDRIGRRPVLAGGLLAFAAASAIGALVHDAGALVAIRFAMGIAAAAIYPTTLSVITAVYPDRRERAGAIGIWGAVTGLGVAVGPVTGGLLLAHFWWGSVFLALVPVALVAAAATIAFVPASGDRDGARLDPPGLALSSAAIGVLVFTIIEAPGAGWGAPRSIAGFALTAVLATAFVLVEHRRAVPMPDVRLFTVPAFSAASSAVTVAFFALFGFIFLITQYTQLVRHYGTLATGVRTLPVAGSIAVGSILGAAAARRVGTRAVVVTGLVAFGASLAWIARSTTFEPYRLISGQMTLMGIGLGLTSTPASESILSVLPPERAGLGSAVNDATRETGGALGVAVVGSVFGTVYRHHLAASPALPAVARSSVTAAIAAAQRSNAAEAGMRPRLGRQAARMAELRSDDVSTVYKSHTLRDDL